MSDREKLIRTYWEKYRHQWPAGLPAMIVPVQHRIIPSPMPKEDYTKPHEPNVLRFHKEYGSYEGLPAQQVVCEGVVLQRVVKDHGRFYPAPLD